MYISVTCIAWVCPLSSSMYSRLNLIPRLCPALRHLQYGKAGRACYLFSHEHNVKKTAKKFRIKKWSCSTNLQGLSSSHLPQDLFSSCLPQNLSSPCLPQGLSSFHPPSLCLHISLVVVHCSDTLTALCDSVSEDCGVRTSQEYKGLASLV